MLLGGVGKDVKDGLGKIKAPELDVEDEGPNVAQSLQSRRSVLNLMERWKKLPPELLRMLNRFHSGRLLALAEQQARLLRELQKRRR